MKTITAHLTDGQYATLDLEFGAFGIDAWFENFALSRARLIVDAIPPLVRDEMIASAIGAGIVHTDIDAVILHALDVGILKTAQQREEELEAELLARRMAESEAPPPVEGEQEEPEEFSEGDPGDDDWTGEGHANDPDDA